MAGIDFAAFFHALVKLFGGAPSQKPLGTRYVRLGARDLPAGVIPSAVLLTDDQPTLHDGIYDAPSGRFTFALPGDQHAPMGATVTMSADGFPMITSRFALIARDPTAPREAVVNQDVEDMHFLREDLPIETKLTRNQLLDIQCDLMIPCQGLGVAPHFDAQGWDAERRIRRTGDQGAIARGIEAGWVWSTTIGNYPPNERQIIYGAARTAGHTHFALHVGRMDMGGGYHGIFPVDQATADNYGQVQNLVFDELVAAGLTPIGFGVSPDAPPAPGLDTAKFQLAATDWDNSASAACRVKAISDAFPNAWLFYELPAGEIYPKPSSCDPVQPTAGGGGDWLTGMHRLFPRFVGVLYEINQPDGLDANTTELQQCTKWWRGVEIQNLCETNTYWKFWDNMSLEVGRAHADELKRRCPWLIGCMSGWTNHPRPDPIADYTPGDGGGATDAINLAQASVAAGDPNSPDVRPWSIVAKLTSFEWADRERFERGDTMVDFTGRDALPAAFGNQGAIAFTLWLGCLIGGQWYIVPIVECIRSYVPTGPMLAPGQLTNNLLYYTKDPLKAYVPRPGEQVAIFCTTGDTRRQNAQAPGVAVGRTNVVLVPWGVGQWTF